MSSPLNPNARKFGKPSTLRGEALEKAIKQARGRAVETETDQVIHLGGVRITVRDTDIIADVVRQVKKDLGIS